MTRKYQVHNFVKNGMTAIAVILISVGCATTSPVEENPVSAELTPMAKPSPILNQRVVEIDKISGEETYFDITQINDDGTYLGSSSNGCGWEVTGDLVSPSISWNGCPSDNPEWNSGENKNMKKKGELWPLVVGNKASYTFNQHNASGQNSGKRTRKCSVEEVVNIEVNGELLDTFKVVCKRVDQGGWWQTNVSYFSPAKGRSVKFVQTNKNDGLKRHKEYLRVEQL